MLTRTTITTIALALAGGAMWSHSGSKLASTTGLDYQPNPLGIKRSPYGQVLAMAIQSPIDADWHGGLEIHDHPHGEHDHDHDHHAEHSHSSHDHDHSAGCDSCEDDHHAEHSHSSHDHDHSAGCDSCEDDHHAEHSPADHSHHSGCSSCEGCGDPSEKLGTKAQELALLDRLQRAVSQRTNPNPPTAGHQLYLRQEIEKKLRFAYELDPSHYANYNCYHLFITQRELGTHGLPQDEVFKMVETLADYTIRYCLAENTDPRPALTATAAAYNVLESMLTANDTSQFSFESMRAQLGVMDFCIRRHFELLDSFIEDGSFANLSSQRQQEVLTRSKFSIKLRDAAEEAINRREHPQPATAGAS